jgi:hypothetical protein
MKRGRRPETLAEIAVRSIFFFMLIIAIRTSLQVSLWSALHSLAAKPWVMATLYDAYFGFLTFFCWLAWRERSLGTKVYGSC